MRKARYSLKKVICRNSSCIGYSSVTAKPGYWIAWRDCPVVGQPLPEARYGRVLGRIDETDRDGTDCKGWLAVMRLSMELTHASIAWVNPADVTHVYEKPPADLLAWITGAEWVKNKDDIARILAMSEHGTTSDQFIASRNDPEKAYNARPQYVKQFILG